MIRTHYFNPKTGRGANNFGDMLVPYILNYISGKKIEYAEAKEQGKVLCIGSELASGIVKKNDIVWGYGANKEKEIILPDGVKLLATRGYKTANLIKNGIPKAYCDPALLMPYIYKPKRHNNYSIGIITHYIDKNLLKIEDTSILKININDNPFTIIDQINACDIIISTSLHGCIVAEAYGIPVSWIKLSKNVIGMEFKWNDYFSSTNRDEQKPIEHIGELTKLNDKLQKILPKPTISTKGLIKSWMDYANGN